MPLVKSTLKAAIKKAFEDQASKTENPAAAMDDLAEKIAAAIDSYVKAATVSTLITGTSPAGPVTGTGTGNLS